METIAIDEWQLFCKIAWRKMTKLWKLVVESTGLVFLSPHKISSEEDYSWISGHVLRIG